MSLRSYLRSVHPLWKAFLWFGITIFFFLITMAVAVGLGGQGASNLSLLRLVQALQSLLVFIIPALLATWCWSETPLRDLRLGAPSSSWIYIIAPLLMLCAVPAINMLADWNSRVELPSFLADLEIKLKQQEEAAAAVTEMFLQADTIWALMGNICLMALLPALSEELCFRGVLINLCLNGGEAEYKASKRRAHLAIWATAALFSFIHFQFYGFVPRMLLGALFGYMVLWSGSIWTSVLAHFTNNTVAVVTYYICAHSELDIDTVDSFGAGSTMWVGCLSVVVAASIALWLRNVCQRQSSEPLL